VDDLWTQERTFGLEDSCILGCYTVTFGKYVQMFRNVSHYWTQSHGVTAQNTWIFSNIAVRTVNFAAFEFYKRLRVCSVGEQQLASQDRSLFWIGHWETGVWSGQGQRFFFSAVSWTARMSPQPPVAWVLRGSFSKGDRSGHEEVRNVWN